MASDTAASANIAVLSAATPDVVPQVSHRYPSKFQDSAPPIYSWSQMINKSSFSSRCHCTHRNSALAVYFLRPLSGKQRCFAAEVGRCEGMPQKMKQIPLTRLHMSAASALLFECLRKMCESSAVTSSSFDLHREKSHHRFLPISERSKTTD